MGYTEHYNCRYPGIIEKRRIRRIYRTLLLTFNNHIREIEYILLNVIVLFLQMFSFFRNQNDIRLVGFLQHF